MSPSHTHILSFGLSVSLSLYLCIAHTNAPISHSYPGLHFTFVQFSETFWSFSFFFSSNLTLYMLLPSFLSKTHPSHHSHTCIHTHYTHSVTHTLTQFHTHPHTRWLTLSVYFTRTHTSLLHWYPQLLSLSLFLTYSLPYCITHAHYTHLVTNTLTLCLFYTCIHTHTRPSLSRRVVQI